MSLVKTNKAIIRAFVEAINHQDWNRLDELVSADFIRHSVAAGSPGVRSRDDLKHFLQQEFVTFPDALETIKDLFGEGDKIAVRHHFQGTQHGPMGNFPPTGKRMKADYLAIYRLENGLIVEAWAEWDNLSGLTQLGHLSM
jgi:steroid delta-isomerase-like uncharacterized protein